MVKKGEDKKENRSIFKSVITVLVLFIAGLIFTRVVLSNILATSGQRLSAANQKVTLLEEENQQLENRISRLNSLSRAEKFANKKGLVKTTNVQLLPSSGPIANR
jgi:cell division protein FtsL